MREFLQTWIDAFHEHRLLTYATAMAMRAFIGFICLTFLGFALLGSFGDEHVWKKHLAPSIEPKVTQPTFDALNAAKPIFGPATRSLPQLPLDVDSQGYLIATSDYDEAIGPAFWERP